MRATSNPDPTRPHERVAWRTARDGLPTRARGGYGTTMSERRGRTRYHVWFPMKLDAPQLADAVAVSRNVSERGVLFVTPSKLEVGAEVTVTFRLKRDDPDRHVQARIVRLEPNPEPEGRILYPYRIAVEFDTPVPEIEPLLREAEEREGAAKG